jgi:uncharacterized membrane protein
MDAVSHHNGSEPDDPILVRREQYRRVAELAQRTGYLLFGLAVVVFVIGFVVGFSSLVVAVIVAGLLVGSVALLPGIVIGYAVKAADREDQARS